MQIKLLPNVLKSCPKSNKSPNLVTLPSNYKKLIKKIFVPLDLYPNLLLAVTRRHRRRLPGLRRLFFLRQLKRLDFAVFGVGLAVLRDGRQDLFGRLDRRTGELGRGRGRGSLGFKLR